MCPCFDEGRFHSRLPEVAKEEDRYHTVSSLVDRQMEIVARRLR